MFEHFIAIIQNWAITTGERQKLQHTYLALIVVVTLIAGAVTLLNADKGHQLMYLVVLMAVAYFANAVVWNLLNSALLSKIMPVRRKK